MMQFDAYWEPINPLKIAQEATKVLIFLFPILSGYNISKKLDFFLFYDLWSLFGFLLWRLVLFSNFIK